MTSTTSNLSNPSLAGTVTPNSPAKVPVATLMSVYAGDRPDQFSEALASVLQQELDSTVESRIYLGVDGPVPQALDRAIAQHADRLFLVFRADRNRGLARTLNALISHLHDEQFVFRMDADDIALPQRYRHQLEYMRRHPDIDILGTAITEFDEASGDERVVHFARGPEDAVARIHKRVPVAHPSVCIRRRVFSAIPGYPTHGTNEDVALWFECIARGFRFDNLTDSLLRYRVSDNFWKRRGVHKALSELTCYLRGIRAVRGPLTLDYLFPLMRFLLRLSPRFVSRLAYRSSFRGVETPLS